MTAYKRRGGKF